MIQVFNHTLIYATACGDLAFALRVCQYVDEEGICCDSGVRGALRRSVALAIKKLPDTAAITSDGDEGGGWKVEGTNATVEELWALDTLLQRWLDTEMEEVADDFLDEEEEESDLDVGFEMDILDDDKVSARSYVRVHFFSVIIIVCLVINCSFGKTASRGRLSGQVYRP